MSRQKAFTLIELLVVISIIALLMAILIPALSRAREMGKRAVCLEHLKQMTYAWVMYAEDWSNRIPNGSHGFHKLLNGCHDPKNRPRATVPWPAWVSEGFDMWNYAQQGEYERGVAMLKDPKDITQVRLLNGTVVSQKGSNVLYKYCQNVDLFKCPTGERGECLTYAIVDSMGGAATWGLPACGGGGNATLGTPALQIMDIARPSDRFVFVDEGRITVDSWTVRWNEPTWHDPPPMRHGKGSNWSYADGHCEYYKWKDKATLSLIDKIESGAQVTAADRTQPCNDDIEWAQRAAWGELGYSPEQEYGCK